MKFWISLIVGLLIAEDLWYKIKECASCKEDFLGFDMPGYVYIVIHTILVFFLLLGAYQERVKTKKDMPLP